MKKACILFLMMLVCVGNIHTVYAGSIEDAVTPAIVEELVLDEELGHGEGVMQKESANEGIVPYSGGVRYEYWLRAYDDYTYIWAYSGVYNVLMDSISTICRAYYTKGTLIGEDVRELNCGQVQACSAIVEVPDNPFNFHAGSAISTHSFYKKGYVPVQEVLTWTK